MTARCDHGDRGYVARTRQAGTYVTPENGLTENE
jgi:hypothetical protein